MSNRPGAVVLVHGLWYGRIALLPLARRLARDSFEPVRFGWSTTRGDFVASADRLAAAAGGIDARPLHFVGHSLGGLLILEMLERAGEALPPGRVVLLGSPVRGSGIARRMAATPGLGFLLGSAGAALTGGLRRAPVGRETGIVAGKGGLGAGRLLGRLETPNDGTVAVAETALPGARDRVVVAASHTGLLWSAGVAARVAEFLRTGAFEPAPGA